MNIIARSRIQAFMERYPGSEQPLLAWYAEAKRATWATPNEVKAQYRSASVLKNNRVVFNIKGNKYRLIVSIDYVRQAAYIKFIGTHEQYDAIDADSVSME
jgi:mRNA interferase HigB